MKPARALQPRRQATRQGPLPEFVLQAAHAAGIPTAEDERRWAQAGDVDRLVRSAIRLVPHIAREFSVNKLPQADLLAEGFLGLVRAAQMFDPDMGARFSTYAAMWIRSAMRVHVHQYRRVVRHVKTAVQRKLFSNLRRVQHSLAAGGQSADPAAVAAYLNVPVKAVLQMEAVLAQRDLVAGDFEGEYSIVAIEAPVDEIVIARSRADAFAGFVEALAKDLTLRERHVLTRRYVQEPPDSLAAIGADLGISRERVRQIGVEAIDKMRALCAALGVYGLDDIDRRAGARLVVPELGARFLGGGGGAAVAALPAQVAPRRDGELTPER